MLENSCTVHPWRQYITTSSTVSIETVHYVHLTRPRSCWINTAHCANTIRRYTACTIDFSRGFWYGTLPCLCTFKGAKLLTASMSAVEWCKSRAHISFLSEVIQIANSTWMRYREWLAVHPYEIVNHLCPWIQWETVLIQTPVSLCVCVCMCGAAVYVVYLSVSVLSPWTLQCSCSIVRFSVFALPVDR